MSEPIPLHAIHHVEFVVGNAKQAAYFYRKAFGFSQVAYRGPETGYRDRASYALEQNDIRLVMTTSLHPTSRTKRRSSSPYARGTTKHTSTPCAFRPRVKP